MANSLIDTFAHRVGRKCFLLKRWPKEKICIDTEQQLIEAAYSKLIEYLLISSPGELNKIWPNVRSQVAKEAERWVKLYSADNMSKRINNELIRFTPLMN